MDSPLYDGFLRGADALLGWILLLPRDLGLLAVALLTSLGIVLVRRWTTDQSMLAQSRLDLAVLKRMMREAKQRGDREARRRHQAVSQRISMKRMGAETKPLLVALIPVAILASWAFERLEFDPLVPGQPAIVSLMLPLSAEGRLAHIVPDERLEAPAGWLRRMERDEEHVPPVARAEWEFVPQASGRMELQFQTDAGTYTHPIESGTRRYAPVLIEHDLPRPTASLLELRERRLFGLVPGIPAMGLPAWMVGYLLITIALVILSRRVLKVD